MESDSPWHSEPTASEPISLARNPFARSRQENVRSQGIGEQLRAVLVTLGRGRTSILIGCAVGLLIGYGYLQLAPKSYTATMVFGPVSNDSTSPLSMVTGGALSALARTPFSQEVSPLDQFRQMLFSSDTGAALLQRPDVLSGVYPGLWNPETKSWRTPHGVVPSTVAALKMALARPAWHPPSADDMRGYVSGNVKIEALDTTGLYRLTYSSTSPEFAREFLLVLYKTTDGILKARQLDRTKKYISYLEHDLDTITNTDERQAVISVLTRQEQALMVSSADVPYSAVVLDAPQVPLKPSSPKVLVGLLLFPLLCGMATLAWLHFFPGLFRRRLTGGEVYRADALQDEEIG